MEEVIFDQDDFSWNPNDNNNFQNKRSDYDNNDISKPSRRFSKPTRIFRPPEISREIWVDGGSRILDVGNSKRYVGAWAFYDKEEDFLSGKAEDKSTNNQMELLANISALEYLDELGYPNEDWITINLDSEYVRLGILFWTKKWAKNNWKRISKDGKEQEIKNLDLWKRLYKLNMPRKIYWKHVKAHNGEPGNEKVDVKCGLLMDQFIKDAKIFE